MFDEQESGSSKTKLIVKTEQQLTPNVSVLCAGVSRPIYTFRRGLWRCSFRQLGHARASVRGTSDKKTPHVVFLYGEQPEFRGVIRQNLIIEYDNEKNACFSIVALNGVATRGPCRTAHGGC